MAISTIGTDALASAAVTSAKLASGAPSRSQLPAGTVLQVVSTAYGTFTSTTSTTFVDTGLTATITPTSSTNKILVIVSANGTSVSSTSYQNSYCLTNGSGSLVSNITGNNNQTNAGVGNTLSLLHSPATTSAYTYKVQFKTNGGGAAYINNYILSNGDTVSTITLMEIAA